MDGFSVYANIVLFRMFSPVSMSPRVFLTSQINVMWLHDEDFDPLSTEFCT